MPKAASNTSWLRKIFRIIPRTLDLFDKGEDTVVLERKRWGLFDIGLSTAKRGSHCSQVLALWGGQPDAIAQLALYLVDENRPLSVAGSNVIKGDC